MSKTYEDECCDCAVPGYPCLGSSCPNRHVPHYFCDACEDEFEPEELYYDDVTDEELCSHCFLKRYKTVKERER